ncbi:MAG: hypothetical protein JST39_04605 [Bacteroidetes bacterium]|nr:hypothetical protein [Bacteroidota bacterium]
MQYNLRQISGVIYFLLSQLSTAFIEAYAMMIKEQFFAINHTPSHIVILTEQQFVMAQAKTGTAFTVNENFETEEGRQFSVGTNIIGIATTSHRNETGVVE